MPYKGAYIPTDYKTITKEDAKRLLAMEARLEEQILLADVHTHWEYDNKQVIAILEYIKGEIRDAD